VKSIPACEYAVIGGSSTFNIDFPEELGLDYVRAIEDGLQFDTPYGRSPAFKRFELTTEEGESRHILTCRMHGWRRGVTRKQASQQVFWVLREAGVQKIIGEGGVGGINHLLKPRDVVVPNDYIDFSMRKDVGLDDHYLLIMREALCPELRRLLVETAARLTSYRVFDRGVYAVTDGRHFESPAEVNLFRMAGADVVGQSLCPEVYLAREIGACYAGIYLVVNYAEGVVESWEHRELEEIFYSEGYSLGRVIVETVRSIPAATRCNCSGLRKETLLKGIY